jgi:opacity protein-like surface antigen
MSVRKVVVSSFVVVLSFLASPAKASADWLFTPFVGTVFNGAADFDDGFDGDFEFERRFTYGASLGYMGAGAIGFEFDFGYTPNFFETTSDDGFDFASDSNVTTFMGNLIIGAPIGGQHGFGVRPFAVGGVGLLRGSVTDIDDFFEVDKNSWGWDVGGGLLIFFADTIGIRGDVRYFRTFTSGDDDQLDFDLGGFDFWRATAGVTFRW